MKKFFITIALLSSLAGAYCEYGRKINESYVGGGKLATYDFGQGRTLSFRFGSGQSIPYSIRFDFYKYIVCED